MKMKQFLQVVAFTAFAGTTAMCSNDNLEDETDDVIEEQQEAAKVAEENPQDTSQIRKEGQDVIEEQREAAAAMRKEVKDKGLDTLSTTTRE